MKTEPCDYQDLPASINKSLVDEFLYALGLKSGRIFEFTSATRNGDWLHLTYDSLLTEPNIGEFSCPRGIDVRISEIEWVADAPMGS